MTIESRVNAFKATVRPILGAVSGNNVSGFRVAVRNKTALKILAAIAERFGGTCQPLLTFGRFPALARVTFEDSEIGGEKDGDD